MIAWTHKLMGQRTNLFKLTWILLYEISRDENIP